MASSVPDAFSDALNGMAYGIDDLIDTDYSPVITPVIDPAQFDSGLNYLNGMLNGSLNDFSIGNVNYNEEFSGKLDSIVALMRNGIDYGLLGQAVANALISSGVHVEMDGGQLVGYIAGEIQDARRMFR